MLQRPSEKYCAFTPVGLSDRQWPNKTITQPPIWLSTDLRDGNQALIEPMTIAKKLRFFDLLVRTGFKEIEIGFPSASQIEFDFVRTLIDEDRIPEDVTIQVLTQSRDDLIARTMESLRGAKRACVHLYNATAPQFRRIVFNMEKKDVIGIAVKGQCHQRQSLQRLGTHGLQSEDATCCVLDRLGHQYFYLFARQTRRFGLYDSKWRSELRKNI